MQRIMSLVGLNTFDWTFRDGRKASGYELHFLRDFEDQGKGQEVYFGRLSYKDASVVDGGLVLGQSYLVISDKEHGKLMAVIPN